MLLREACYVPLSMARQHAGRGAIDRRRCRQLDRMLAFCRQHVPFYRDDRSSGR
jgi:hypothetical protein